MSAGFWGLTVIPQGVFFVTGFPVPSAFVGVFLAALVNAFLG